MMKTACAWDDYLPFLFIVLIKEAGIISNYEGEKERKREKFMGDYNKKFFVKIKDRREFSMKKNSFESSFDWY